MGQLRTANKRRKRAIIALQDRKDAVVIAHETDSQPVRTTN